MIEEALILSQIIFIDIILAADNAIIIGLIAANFVPKNRKLIIFWGVVGALIFKVLFAIFATYLFQFYWIKIIGGLENKLREGLVSFSLPQIPSEILVNELNLRGVRTHIRKSDHYSSNILEPLDLESCVRVSMCHYNSEEEVIHFLTSINEITDK